MSHPVSPVISISKNQEELHSNLRNFLEDRLRHLQDQHGAISIGVSGGSMPKQFTDAILSLGSFVDWKRIRIFMCDERYCLTSHEDSNLGAYLKLFPKQLHECLLPVPIEETVARTADSFERVLRTVLMPEQFGNTPRFDILLLGVGPDGHTCSIFPNAERLPKITDLNWISATSTSPKPPAERVTLTLPVINAAKNVAFIICGRSKAPIVRAMCQKNAQLPASQVRPLNGKLWYFLDADAALEIPAEAQQAASPGPIDE